MNDIAVLIYFEHFLSVVVQNTTASSCFQCGENCSHDNYGRCLETTQACSHCLCKDHLGTCCIEDLIHRNKDLQQVSKQGEHACVTEASVSVLV